MIILILTFALLFLAVFAICLNVSFLWQEKRDLRAFEERQRVAMQLDNDSAWYRNRYTVMR
jgi:hypothetical protein